MCQDCVDSGAMTQQQWDEAKAEAPEILSGDDLPGPPKEAILSALGEKLGLKKENPSDKMRRTLKALVDHGAEVDDIRDDGEAVEAMAGRFMFGLEPKNIALALASYVVLTHRDQVGDEMTMDLDSEDPVGVFATLAADWLDEAEDNHGPESVPAAYIMLGGDPSRLDVRASDAGYRGGMYP